MYIFCVGYFNEAVCFLCGLEKKISWDWNVGENVTLFTNILREKNGIQVYQVYTY
jgi:hypothetical protein